MELLRQYILSLTCVAMLGGVILSIVQDTKAKNMLRILVGLLMTIAVLMPFARMDWSGLAEVSFSFASSADAAAVQGENMARRAVGSIIKDRTEAYILDKAADMNTEISVEITLSEGDPPIPAAAEIHGDVTPYTRRQLQTILQEDLGIAKENQTWIGGP